MPDSVWSSTSSPDVDLITGASSSDTAIPIIGPPIITFLAEAKSVSQCSRTVLIGVPIRTSKFLGDRTAGPVTVTILW